MTRPIMGTTAGATTTRIILNNSNGVAASGSKTLGYVDVSRALSQVNHRLYRQGRMYMVRAGFAVGSATGPIGVQALQNSWMVRKAWKMGLSEYNRATRANRARSGQGRWRDFRVNINKVQYDGGHTYAEVEGYTEGSTDLYQTQVYNQDQPGDGNLMEFHVIGADSTDNVGTSTGSFGLLANYDVTQNVVVDDPPNPGGTVSAYEALNTTAGDNTQDDLLLAEGDFPPYNPEALQHIFQSYEINTAAANGPAHMTPWIAAPCGLLMINGFGSDGSVRIAIEVMHGDYKGVLSEPM